MKILSRKSFRDNAYTSRAASRDPARTVCYSFEVVLKAGLSGFQNSRPHVVKTSKLFGLKIYFQTYSITTPFSQREYGQTGTLNTVVVTWTPEFDVKPVFPETPIDSPLVTL